MNSDSKPSNRRLILDTIRRSAPIARIDLAQATKISQATVTTITADMIKQGLIEEVTSDGDASNSRRGRPRVDLKLRGDSHLVAGLKLSDNSISVVLVDFEGCVVQEFNQESHQSNCATDEIIDRIQSVLEKACAAADLTVSRLSAIGIGLSGMIDAMNGMVHWSPLIEERNIAFAEMLSDVFSKPVFVDNEANLVTIAEQYLGDGRDVRNFIVVTIENGVGMGVVIDNELYRGARGCAAEFGHSKVHLDGALCRCGQRGCLEAYVADYALLREASFNTPNLAEKPIETRIQDLLEAARDGDQTAASIVKRSSRIFAMGLSNLVNIFDPELIILAGERMQFDHLYAEEVVETIRKQIVQVDANPAKIIIHKWGPFMWARGAAAFALGGVAELALREGKGS